jgi:hypothetical protein
VKVTAWCAISSGCITGTCFFEDVEQTVTMNAEQYMEMLETFLRNELNLLELNSLIHCGFNKVEQSLTQHRFTWQFSGRCFQADSFLILGTSTGLPACLIFQQQITFFGAMSKSKCQY